MWLPVCVLCCVYVAVRVCVCVCTWLCVFVAVRVCVLLCLSLRASFWRGTLGVCTCGISTATNMGKRLSKAMQSGEALLMCQRDFARLPVCLVSQFFTNRLFDVVRRGEPGVSWARFLWCMDRLFHGPPHAMVALLFDVYDLSGLGRITLDDFTKFCALQWTQRGGGGRVGWDYQFQLSDILLAV